METSSEIKLTTAQKARMEKNRLKAVMLKEAKLIPHPSAKIDTDNIQQSIVKVQGTRFIDSGGGFLLEETTQNSGQAQLKGPALKLVKKLPPILDKTEQPTCMECSETFSISYLYETFRYETCDKCRDPDDKHSLITRTEAKNEYLLKDCDLDKREPILKCIVRQNPHNPRWGSMKLYLHIQIEERAIEVWGSPEALMEEKERRLEKRDESKSKKYSKQLKELRMNVRSSLYNKTKAKHEHTYGPDTYNEEDDTFTHVCTVCQHSETFEKM